jgi:hypothetical protein
MNGTSYVTFVNDSSRIVVTLIGCVVLYIFHVKLNEFKCPETLRVLFLIFTALKRFNSHRIETLHTEHTHYKNHGTVKEFHRNEIKSFWHRLKLKTQ